MCARAVMSLCCLARGLSVVSLCDSGALPRGGLSVLAEGVLFTWGPCAVQGFARNPVLGYPCSTTGGSLNGTVPTQVAGLLAGRFVTHVAVGTSHTAVVAGASSLSRPPALQPPAAGLRSSIGTVAKS